LVSQDVALLPGTLAANLQFGVDPQTDLPPADFE